MGIERLLPFLASSTETRNLREFNGCSVAVDASSWLHKSLYACSDELLQGILPTNYQEYIQRKISCLLAFGLKPVLVFDGKPPPIKERVNEYRAKQREHCKRKAEEAFEEGRNEDAKKQLARAAPVAPHMVRGVIEMCRERGIDYVVAPCEADAQLAYLNKSGFVDFVLTEDSDVLVFGAEKVLLKSEENGQCQLIEKKNLNESLKFEEFSEFKFKAMCILAGCDYLENIKGVGVKRANQIASVMTPQNYDTKLMAIGEVLQRANLEVPHGYLQEFHKAMMTFCHQPVYDPRSRRIMPIESYPDGVDETSLSYAGEMYESSLAFQIAIGNISWDRLNTVRSFFDPDNPNTKLSSTSIWKKLQLHESLPPSSTVMSKLAERHQVKHRSVSEDNGAVKSISTVNKSVVKNDAPYKIQPKFQRRVRAGAWSRSSKQSNTRGLACTMAEIIGSENLKPQSHCPETETREMSGAMENPSDARMDCSGAMEDTSGAMVDCSNVREDWSGARVDDKRNTKPPSQSISFWTSKIHRSLVEEGVQRSS